MRLSSSLNSMPWNLGAGAGSNCCRFLFAGWWRLEDTLSIVTLAFSIWVLRFLLPKARREQEGFAMACSVLTLALALFVWLLIGVVRLF